VSGHVGEAIASPSPPEGLDPRQERYWLIERRCKDLCLYLDKRALKRLKRKAANGCSLETTMAYLSHAKDTASLKRVAGILWQANPRQRPEVRAWLAEHRPRSLGMAALHPC